MATEPEHIKHLTYEFKIYAQLEIAGVEGIACSLGILQEHLNEDNKVILTSGQV